MAVVRMRKSKARGVKKKYIFYGIGLIAFMVAVLGFIFSGIEQEPLSSRQIIQKKEWTKNEVSDTLVMLSMKHKKNGQNKYVMEHMRKTINKFSEKDRKEIVEKTILGVIDRISKNWGGLDQEKREKVIEGFHKEMIANRKKFEKLHPEQQKKIKEKLGSSETQKWIRDINAKIINRVNPDDRKALAPITKEIIHSLESL